MRTISSNWLAEGPRREPGGARSGSPALASIITSWASLAASLETGQPGAEHGSLDRRAPRPPSRDQVTVVTSASQRLDGRGSPWA